MAARVNTSGSGTMPCGSVTLEGTAGGSWATTATGGTQISANAQKSRCLTMSWNADCGPSRSTVVSGLDLFSQPLDVGGLDQVVQLFGRDRRIDFEVPGNVAQELQRGGHFALGQEVHLQIKIRPVI